MKNKKERYIEEGKEYLEDEEYEDFKSKYLEILSKAKEERKKDLSTNAYKKEEINLINRLVKYCRNHLLFLKKFFVPFSNNRAEFDLREIKIKQKNGKFRILSALGKWYVNVIRGTPMLLQLMIIYYVMFKSVNISPVLVGIIAFGLNSSAYVAEIIKSGINSVDIVQYESALSLGFNYSKTMIYVVLPQAIKNILPTLGNELVTLIKETSVAGYIGIVDLTKASDIIASNTYNYFFPLIITAIIYFILTTILTKLLNKVTGGEKDA